LLEGQRLAPDAAGAIVERAGGNPFFIEELVRDAGEAPPGRAASGVALPTTVQEVVLARADRLDGRARGVLQLGAVIGRTVPRSLLAALAAAALRLDPGALEHALQTLGRQQFVSELPALDGERRWQFGHA